MIDEKAKIKKLEEKLARIERISQLPKSATLSEVIDAINKITNSLKR
jgi:hypothetical protein